MARNNEGQLTVAERKEFAALADRVHQISVQNARMLLSERRRTQRRVPAAKGASRHHPEGTRDCRSAPDERA
jgi:hypothetical protein